MVSNILADDVEAVFETAFGDADIDGELLVVDPSASTAIALIEASVAQSDLPSMSMLITSAALKTVMDDFLIASKAADLVDRGVLSIRVLSDPASNTLIVSDAHVLALLTTEPVVAALATDDTELVDVVNGRYRELFESAADYNLRTPSISRVRKTMDEDIGETTRQDFDMMFEAMDEVDATSLDEVTIALLVAAKNDVLLYDISKWGEDVGIASKATFSRTKTRLEDRGIIDTEKVPIDVGRPRLRLKLGDDRLIGIDAAELAETAAKLLSYVADQ